MSASGPTFQVSTTRTVKSSPAINLTVGALRLLIDGQPDSSKVDVSYYAGDAREPSEVSLSITEVDRG